VATAGTTRTVTPLPVPVSVVIKLKAQPVQARGHWQVEAFDAVSGKSKFLVALPKSQSGRPEVIVSDLNGDGNDDLLITYRVGPRKRRLSVDGLTGASLRS
jgi:hypothetical protein